MPQGDEKVDITTSDHHQTATTKIERLRENKKGIRRRRYLARYPPLSLLRIINLRNIIIIKKDITHQVITSNETTTTPFKLDYNDSRNKE